MMAALCGCSSWESAARTDERGCQRHKRRLPHAHSHAADLQAGWSRECAASAGAVTAHRASIKAVRPAAHRKPARPHNDSQRQPGLTSSTPKPGARPHPAAATVHTCRLVGRLVQRTHPLRRIVAVHAPQGVVRCLSVCSLCHSQPPLAAHTSGPSRGLTARPRPMSRKALWCLEASANKGEETSSPTMNAAGSRPSCGARQGSQVSQTGKLTWAGPLVCSQGTA